MCVCVCVCVCVVGVAGVSSHLCVPLCPVCAMLPATPAAALWTSGISMCGVCVCV